MSADPTSLNPGLQLTTPRVRYSRESILEKFSPDLTFPITPPKAVAILYLPISSEPCTSLQGFSHPLGDSFSIPRPQAQPREKKPEAIKTPNKHHNRFYSYDHMASESKKKKQSGRVSNINPDTKKIVATSEVLLDNEEIMKNLQENEGKIMIPAYDKELLLRFVSKGNPFAKAMIEIGIQRGEDDDKVFFPIGSRPYERIWYYKDPLGSIQGPYSCIEMFNWTIRELFPESLEISFCKTEFIPMNSYLIHVNKHANIKPELPSPIETFTP